MLFRTILSFCQCWPRVFLVKYRGIWAIVGVALAASGYYYQKINCSKKAISEKWCYSVGNAWSVFLYNIVWGLLGITQGFYLCDVVPKVLRRHWTEFLHVKCCLEAYWTIFITRVFYLWLYNVAPREFKTPRTRINSCVMSSRTSRTALHRVFLVQCCSRSIKKTLSQDFFWFNVVWSLLAWATLHKVSTSAMLSQGY